MTTKTENVLARIPQKKLINTNVLIVVEKYLSGKLLQHLLEKQNLCVTGICTSGHDALEKIKKNKPDLVLTDMNLRDCGGVYFAQQLNFQEDGFNVWIYFTEFASDLIVQQTMALANELGCNIGKYGSDGCRVNFESYYNQANSFDKSGDLITRIATQPIRVFLVDDQQIVLLGLEKLIESEKPKMEVVGKAMSIVDAKLPVMEEQPDILIINICLTNIDSIDCVADFVNNGNTRVIIFTDTNDNDLIDQAVLNGARGVLDRKESMQTILRAVQKVHDGELWLDRMTTARIFLQSSRIRGKIAIDADIDIDKPLALTRKECMILKAFSDGTGGEQNKQIAAKLCMSEHTLRNHLTSIFGKLGIKNRFGLFAYAKQHFQQLENALAMEESAIREQ